MTYRALESACSVRFLYQHFLSGITKKSLNAFYYVCSYAKIDYSGFMNVTARAVIRLIPDSLKSQPVFLCIDDTMVTKFGMKFERMKYIPLFLYSFCWSIEISYYEQKTFWYLCNYMMRSCKGIEMMVNLINVAYCAMKLLPYQDKSVQDFRFALSEGIRQQVFFVTFVQNIETRIKSSSVINALKQAFFRQAHFL